MSNRMKVMTVIGTRPEIIRLSRVMPKLDQYCEHTIVHTGQNYDYELNEIFFNDLGIRAPDHFLEAAGQSASETIGQVIIKMDEILQEIKPEALLVLGDTNSCLSVIPAKRRKIPIFHMEAGNRCFDERVPEEINRKIVDHTSDINLTYSSIAREYLIAEGLPAERVIKTGSPMLEIINHHHDEILSSKILKELDLKPMEYFLVSAHREENVDSEGNLKKLTDILNGLASKYNLPVLVSTHPRTLMRIKDAGITVNKNVDLANPFGYLDYVKLQINAKATLSDSGTITEESSILNFPALNIREAHERPEGMEEASVIMTGLDLDVVLNSLLILDDQKRGKDRQLRAVSDYNSPNVSDKVLRIILSYTNYVNRVVWKKY